MDEEYQGRVGKAKVRSIVMLYPNTITIHTLFEFLSVKIVVR